MRSARRSLAVALALATLSGCAALDPLLAPTNEVHTPGVRQVGPGSGATTSSDPDLVYDSPDRPVTTALPLVRLPGFVTAPPGRGLERYIGQPLRWVRCGEAECATIAAPLDHDAPDGQAITLALERVRATTRPRLGTLFVNPGGPGVPGRWLAANLRRTGLEQYDIVAWDPRGTGASTPIVCANGAPADAYLNLDASPDDPTEDAALLAGTKAFVAGCVAGSGALLSHISTADTVSDLELLRRLLREPRVNWLGYSYGTLIGAMYADRYPTTTGRVVLDSPINLTRDTSVVQAVGFEDSLGAFGAWCARQRCGLGSTREAVVDTVRALLERLDASPLPVGRRSLTQTLAALGIAAFLYAGERNFPPLRAAIAAALAKDGAPLLASADRLNDRRVNGRYDTSFFALPAILCLDWPDRGLAGAREDWAADRLKAPTFGTAFGPGFTCPLWPVAPEPDRRLTAAGAPTILVVGARIDPATPYVFSVWAVQQLSSAVLLTYEGAGHATYGSGRSRCVDAAVVAYLARGDLPRRWAVCRS